MVGGFGVATRLKSGEILVTGCVCEGGNVYVLLDLWTDPNATKQTAQLAFGLLARSLVVGGTVGFLLLRERRGGSWYTVLPYVHTHGVKTVSGARRLTNASSHVRTSTGTACVFAFALPKVRTHVALCCRPSSTSVVAVRTHGLL